MIILTAQRNDHKTQTDRVSATEDTLSVNGLSFSFREGINITFDSPHENIIAPYRDENGILHATILVQYCLEDKVKFESKNEQGEYYKPLLDPTQPLARGIKQANIYQKSADEISQEQLSINISRYNSLREELLDELILKIFFPTSLSMPDESSANKVQEYLELKKLIK